MCEKHKFSVPEGGQRVSIQQVSISATHLDKMLRYYSANGFNIEANYDRQTGRWDIEATKEEKNGA